MPIKIRRSLRRGSIIAAAVEGLEPRSPHRWIRPWRWWWSAEIGSRGENNRERTLAPVLFSLYTLPPTIIIKTTSFKSKKYEHPHLNQGLKFE
jgi:hypothetical protein